MVLKRETLLAVGNVEKILLLLYAICVYKYVCDTFLVPSSPTLSRVANFSSVHTFFQMESGECFGIFMYATHSCLMSYIKIGTYSIHSVTFK